MTEVVVVQPNPSGDDATSSCRALPQSSSSDDAGQSTQSTTSPTSVSSTSLAETIEAMFSVEYLRMDHALLSGMDGRMLIAVDALVKHPRVASLVPRVVADDIVAVGRGTKKVVMEEYPVGVFRMGPLPQAHPKSKCTITLQCRPLNNSGATPSTDRRLSSLIPDRDAAQGFLQNANNGGHASQCNVLHYYECPTTHAIFLTFADERVAKQAFLDAQQKTVDNIKVDVKLRIEQGHPAPHYSNQGHPATAGHYPNHGASSSSGAIGQPKRAPIVPNPNAPPHSLPTPQFPLPLQGPHNPFVAMMALGMFPFLMPPLGMVPPAGFLPPHPQQTGTPQPPLLQLGIGAAPTKRTPTSTPVAAPAAATATSKGASVFADNQSSPLSASTTSGGSQPLSVPSTPATPSTLTDSQRQVGTKYRLDPYSNRGRVVEDELIPSGGGVAEDGVGACPQLNSVVVGPPQAIDAYCLPSAHEAASVVEGGTDAPQLTRAHPPLRRGGSDAGQQRRTNRLGMEGGFCRPNARVHAAPQLPALPEASFPPLADNRPPAAMSTFSVPLTSSSSAGVTKDALTTGVPSVELAMERPAAPPSKASYASILLRSAGPSVQHDAS